MDELCSSVAARAGDAAGVPNRVARLEQGDIGAHGRDNTGRIPSDDFVDKATTGTHLHVNRIDRDRRNFHEDVVAGRSLNGELFVDEALISVDRPAAREMIAGASKPMANFDDIGEFTGCPLVRASTKMIHANSAPLVTRKGGKLPRGKCRPLGMLELRLRPRAECL